MADFSNSSIHFVLFFFSLVTLGACGVAYLLYRKMHRLAERHQFSRAVWNARMQASRDGVLIAHINGAVVDVNNRFFSICGVPVQPLSTIDDFFSLLGSVVDGSLSSYEQISDLEITHKKDQPSVLHLHNGATVEYAFVPILSSGECLGYTFTLRDVTELQSVIQDLTASNERLETIINSVPLGVIELDLDGNVGRLWSKSAEEMHGWTHEEVYGSPPPGIYPDRLPLYREFMKQVADGGTIDGVFTRQKTKSGNDIFLEIFAAPLRDAEGRVTSIISLTMDVTEQKKEERLLKLLSNTTLDAVYVYDTEHRLVYGNPACETVTGYDMEDIEQKPFLFALHQGDRERVLDLMQLVYAGERIDTEYRVVRKNGEARWVSASWQPMRGDNLRMVGVQGRESDISGRKRAEFALAKSRDFTRRIIDTAPLMIIQTDESGYIIHLNKMAENILTLVPGQMDDESLFPRVFSGSELEVQERFNLWRDGGYQQDCSFESDIVFTDNSTRTIAWNCSTISRDDERRELFLFGSDITFRKNIERELMKSSQMTRALLDNVWIGVEVVSHERKTLSENRKMAEMFPSAMPRIFQKCAQKFYPDGSVEICPGCPFDETIQTGEQRETTLAVSRDGDQRHYRVVTTPLWGIDGSVESVLETVHDITDMVRAHDRIKASEEEYRRLYLEYYTLLEAMPDALVVFSPEEAIVWANAQAREMFGDAIGEEGGHCFEKIMQKSSPCGSCVVRKALATRSAIEDQQVSGDGRYLDIKAVPVIGDNGSVTNVVVILRDTTDRVRLQTEAVKNRHLSMLGRLSASVAHEINNPNNSILANADMLTGIMQDIEKVAGAVLAEYAGYSVGGFPAERALTTALELSQRIGGGSRRIRDIVKNLKGFAMQDQVHDMTSVDLNAVVDDALTLLGTQIQAYTVHFVVEKSPNLPRITGNHQQIEQVLINLVMNALESLPTKESGVTVETRVDEDTVILQVQDSGSGISPDSMRNLLEPFFTTKHDRGGTGLGLTISKKILDDHGAELVFKSQTGEGTTATVRFPKR